MARISVFTRKDTPHGAVFSVTPADRPAGSGCVIFVGWAFVILVIGWAIVAGIGSGTAFAPLVLSAILWGPVLVFVLLARKGVKDVAPRKAVTITVNREGLSAAGRTYAAADVREIVVDPPTPASVEVISGAGIGYAIGAATAKARKEVSYSLLVRTKASSASEILVFGLNFDVATSLRNDIWAELKG